MNYKPLNEEDSRFLRIAAEQALKGRGGVEPNPLVGAVVVKNSRIMAKGHHALYGGPHAEVQALRKAGADSRDATLYVTLEPCSSQGKTPPCTEAVLAAGIKRMVVGAIDPDPRHRSAGLSLLSDAGLEVQYADDAQCNSLLNEFRRNLERDTPYVILKWAMTLDGRIAARNGSSQWISGEVSRRAVHRLRGHVDAVMVGSGTVQIDDPSLNCRLRNAALVPARVVIDPRLEVPPTAHLVRNASKRKDDRGFSSGPVVFYAGPQADSRRKECLEGSGVEVVSLAASPEDRSGFLKEALVDLKRK
ncbi:MAG: bifunctional diaminohydroxyphosphoribosylaminopyrimidine deaminase/5-amino-6-(5-phosphoribosylamino)uracil reductase RibD [Planctomycetota bacterium]